MTRRLWPAVILAIVMTMPSLGIAEAADVNTITVAATKQVDVDADTARVTFGVRSRDESALAATRELSARTDGVLDALRGAGFDDDELATTDLSLERVCLRECSDPRPHDGIPNHPVYGYRGTAAIQLETQKLDRLGTAIDSAIAGGATAIRGISYTVEDKDAAVLEALREAMRAARDKASVIAEEAGRTLGPAIIITEGRTSAPSSFSLLDRGVSSDTVSAGGGAAETIPFPAVPPTLHASAHVEVTYEMQ